VASFHTIPVISDFNESFRQSRIEVAFKKKNPILGISEEGRKIFSAWDTFMRKWKSNAIQTLTCSLMEKDQQDHRRQLVVDLTLGLEKFRDEFKNLPENEREVAEEESIAIGREYDEYVNVVNILTPDENIKEYYKVGENVYHILTDKNNEYEGKLELTNDYIGVTRKSDNALVMFQRKKNGVAF